ncbi:hypothetical protein SDC9_206146 [bioreactor metagenome]|uniref:Uncharacterized protein n=1 Tax=bioreactor metagenome TaxID=1076179 RepID=A0A645J483_9ZZZZ
MDAGTVIFEGSQGVLLDEGHGFHPHTTWSTITPRHLVGELDVGLFGRRFEPQQGPEAADQFVGQLGQPDPVAALVEDRMQATAELAFIGHLGQESGPENAADL